MKRLGITLLAASACGLHDPPRIEPSGERPRAAAPSPELTETARVVAPGMVEAWGGEIDLSPSESGTIAQLWVREGEEVTAGQLLASLGDASQLAAVEVARAEVAEAEVGLAKALRGATKEALQEVRAEAEVSALQASLAEKDAERTGRLSEFHAVAAAEAERAKAQAAVAAAAALASAARRAALERGERAEDRRAAYERLQGAKARLKLAEANLERRRIIAPVKARVLLSRFREGEFFSTGGAPLFVLGELSKLQVRLEVDEIDAFRVERGAVCALLDDNGVHLAAGTVVRLAPIMGRRGLARESPTARADVRVREVFVETPFADGLVPGRRVWGHIVIRPALDGGTEQSGR